MIILWLQESMDEIFDVIDDFYNHQQINPTDKITRTEFEIAYSIVTTRYKEDEPDFDKPEWFEEEETCGSLVPVFDMINHHHEPNCDWNVENGVEIITQDKIEKGRELFIAYGSHGNDLLIQYYGFTSSDQYVSITFST